MRSTMWFLVFGIAIGTGIQLASAAETTQPIVMGDFPDQTDGAADAEGNVHVVYSDQKKPHAYYRVYPADMGSPSPAVDVSGKLEIIVGCERGPKVALGKNGAIYVAW